jgi:hypothetical protein
MSEVFICTKKSLFEKSVNKSSSSTRTLQQAKANGRLRAVAEKNFLKGFQTHFLKSIRKINHSRVNESIKYYASQRISILKCPV